MRLTPMLVFLAASGLAGLSGCSESPNVTLHEPGQFKGARDPLLDQQGSARQEALGKRFQLVQQDR